ncbi:hypothetical protein SESBI_17808 [Sesbania bispinosa]|nr:hypothetical protein SESBI_17808 [Sesbania bispinosa]
MSSGSSPELGYREPRFYEPSPFELREPLPFKQLPRNCPSVLPIDQIALSLELVLPSGSTDQIAPPSELGLLFTS